MALPRRFSGSPRRGEPAAGADFDGNGDLSGRTARRLSRIAGGRGVFYFAGGADDAGAGVGLPTIRNVAGVLWGVKPVVVVLLVQAVWSLAKAALKSRELMFLALLVLGLAAAHVATLALLIGTGVAWMVATRFGEKRGNAAAGVSSASLPAGANAGDGPSGTIAGLGGVSSFLAVTTSGV